MHRPGRIGTGTIVGLVIGVLVLIGGGAFVVDVAKKVLGGPYPTQTIDVRMHDESSLEPGRYVNRDLNARFRLPKGMPGPRQAPTPDSEITLAWGGGGQAFLAARGSKKGMEFHAFVKSNRIGMRRDLKNCVFETEGVATIDGHETYVATVQHDGPGGTRMRSRIYMIDGPDGKAYMLYGLAEAGRFASVVDAFDSAASTLEIGSFPDEKPVAAAPRPVPSPPMPAMTPPSPGGSASGDPQASSFKGLELSPRVAGQPITRRGGREAFVEGHWVPVMVGEEKDGRTEIQFQNGRPETYWIASNLVRMREGGSGSETPTSSVPGMPAPRKYHGFMEAQINGEWVPVVVTDEKDDKITVRVMRTGATATVGPQELRPRTFGSTGRSRPVPGVEGHAVTPPAGGAGGATPSAPSTPAAHGGGEASLDDALTLLTSSNRFDPAKGAKALVSIAPDKEHQAAIIAKLTPLLKDFFAKDDAARALGVWADDATERKFIGSFLNAPKNDRYLIFLMLGQRKTAPAARAVAVRLRVADDADTAEKTLKEMGTVAEPAVRGMLVDSDKKVKERAIAILKEIGTKESVATLETVAKNPDAGLALDAKMAIKAIDERNK